MKNNLIKVTLLVAAACAVPVLQAGKKKAVPGPEKIEKRHDRKDVVKVATIFMNLVNKARKNEQDRKNKELLEKNKIEQGRKKLMNYFKESLEGETLILPGSLELRYEDQIENAESLEKLTDTRSEINTIKKEQLQHFKRLKKQGIRNFYSDSDSE